MSSPSGGKTANDIIQSAYDNATTNKQAAAKSAAADQNAIFSSLILDTKSLTYLTGITNIQGPAYLVRNGVDIATTPSNILLYIATPGQTTPSVQIIVNGTTYNVTFKTVTLNDDIKTTTIELTNINGTIIDNYVLGSIIDEFGCRAIQFFGSMLLGPSPLTINGLYKKVSQLLCKCKKLKIHAHNKYYCISQKSSYGCQKSHRSLKCTDFSYEKYNSMSIKLYNNVNNLKHMIYKLKSSNSVAFINGSLIQYNLDYIHYKKSYHYIQNNPHC